MVRLDTAAMADHSTYKLLNACVVPRPIAWVSTSDGSGSTNVAPFSYFMAVSGVPPMVAFSVANDRRNGMRKDTIVNVERSGEFVVNVVDAALADRMNTTSTEFAPEVDEFAAAELTAIESVHVAAPRIAESPISLECRVEQFVRFGNSEHVIVVGDVVCFHIRDDLYSAETGRVDMAALSPVGRLAGHMYTHADIFEMARKELDYRG